MNPKSSKHPFPVPGEGRVSVDTPSTWAMIQLLGAGFTYEGYAFSRDQERALKRSYGFSDAYDKAVAEELLAQGQARYEEQLADWKAASAVKGLPERREAWDAYREKWGVRGYGNPDEPKPPSGVSSEGLLQAGSLKNLTRHISRDGLRVMAFLARYLEEGQDPVKLVAQLAIEAGFDVPDDVDWIYEEPVDDEEAA